MNNEFVCTDYAIHTNMYTLLVILSRAISQKAPELSRQYIVSYTYY